MLEIAKTQRTIREMELNSGQYEHTPAVKKRANLIDYLDKISLASSESSRRNYVRLKKSLLKFNGNNQITFGEIDKSFAEKYKRFLLDEYAQNTCNLYFTLLLVALNKAVEDKVLASNPIKGVKNILQIETDKTYW